MVKRVPKGSFSRLSPHLRGEIWGLHRAGYTNRAIASMVVKGDGKHPSKDAVRDAVVLRKKKGPRWDGIVQHKAGAPRQTTDTLQKKIRAIVFKFRGKAKVDRAFIQKSVKAARKVSGKTISRRLAEAGLAWLRRRRKTLVPKKHKVVRIAFSKWVLKRKVDTLTRWVYSDGTTFFLAKGWDDDAQKKRAALGTHVWRMANGSDGLYEDCVGPSAYAKAQGTPVRIWGLLANGRLYVVALPAGTGMTIKQYVKVIEKNFVGWIKDAFWKGCTTYLVQDHERSLWNDKCKVAFKKANIQLLENYPKSSQDLNAIEVAWRELKARLYETAPTKLEKRTNFLRRVHNAVAWVNKNRADLRLMLCQGQKGRARQVLAAKGARIPEKKENAA